MRISISNIAWDISEDDEVAQLLTRYGVSAIDVAPGKYFSRPEVATSRDIDQVRIAWAKRGFEIFGMQALLFGTSGLNMFGNTEMKEAMLDRLAAVCRIGAGLGAKRLVFGSPRNRDRGRLRDDEVMAASIGFFRSLGDIAAANGVVVCLEPNPARYGANFMTNSDQTAHVVEAVDHPAIKMQFDTGALTINGEDPWSVLERCHSLIEHVHASEPDLVPLGDLGTDHRAFSRPLETLLPDATITIEMLATKDERHVESIERAVNVAVNAYGNTDY